MCNERVQPVFRDCPYCGYEEGYITIINSFHTKNGKASKGYQVQCTYCNTSGPWSREVADAIRGWNRLPRDINLVTLPEPKE